MVKLKLSSKAKTLVNLRAIIKSAKVLPIVNFYVKDYLNNKDKFINQILKCFDSKLLIVRSSSSSEDNEITSHAGSFESILNVPSNNKKDISDAITKVIDSYGVLSSKDEVFIQPMLENVLISGVAFSADISNLTPYYIISYDDSGSTQSVTMGSTNTLKTLIHYKNYDISNLDDNLQKIIKMIQECSGIFKNKYLDIEFAIDKNNELYVFQVRTIVINDKTRLDNFDLDILLKRLYNKILKLNIEHPNLLGEKAIFGVMPDWNPAEIIGLRPKRLALSMYKELITDEVWAYQRDNYGYRNLRSHPLLISFFGVPYIDVRVSFNSFIPKDLNDTISEKLVNYYLNELANSPHNHDKVEFEIVHSCYYLSLPKKLKSLLNNGFNEREIKRIEFSLLKLTNNIIDIKNGLYRKDLNKAKILNEKYEKVITSNLSLVDKIYWLTANCKRYGTLPFAGVARAGFIAIQLLNSFVEVGIFSKQEHSTFLNSLNTISKKLNNDLYALSQHTITKEKFLEKYGHLRPGTYDILSHRYDEDFEKYFSLIKRKKNLVEKFEFTQEQKNLIDLHLSENGILSNAQDIISFIKEAIEGREYVKFVFTKSISKILQLIEEFGGKFNLNNEELAFLDFKRVLDLYSTLDNREVKDILDIDIQKNKQLYKYTQAVKLPSLIVNPNEIYSFYLEDEEANFVTLKCVKSEIVLENKIKGSDLSGKIVFIESADPGYDFLFTKNIAGLVTQFGGANSHMAIRCAELGIPAVIGCGENMFKKYSKALVLEINALNKYVRILS